MDPRFEIIDALIDGERVDATALKRALSEDEGRDYLVDAWLLREGVQDETALDATIPAPVSRMRSSRSWLAAAAIVTVSLISGYAIGYRMAGTTESTATNTRPVAPVPAVIETTPAPGSFPAPAPTRVIRLDFGTRATSDSGGN